MGCEINLCCILKIICFSFALIRNRGHRFVLVGLKQSGTEGLSKICGRHLQQEKASLMSAVIDSLQPVIVYTSYLHTTSVEGCD